jgi:non-reducing end alpha-L-arabinofuranosidase
VILRDAAGMVVDSLNYGNVIDPWSSEGYQAASGTGKDGCFVASPTASGGFGPAALAASATNKSAGRVQDGVDTDSNCTDFSMQPATTLPIGSAVGATNIKVGSVAGFTAGQSITVDAGASVESAAITTVGTAGATTASAATAEGATVIPVASPMGFVAGASITIDDETATIASVSFNRGGATITVAAPLAHAHAAGAQISGSGITLNAALTQAHPKGAQIERNAPTPGAPNKYDRP